MWKLLWTPCVFFVSFTTKLMATFTQPVCVYLLFTSVWLLCKVTGSDLASCCFVLQRNLVTNILPSILFWLHIFEGLEGCKYAFLGEAGSVTLQNKSTTKLLVFLPAAQAPKKKKKCATSLLNAWCVPIVSKWKEEQMKLNYGSWFAFHTCVCNLISLCERGGLMSLEIACTVTEDSNL